MDQAYNYSRWTCWLHHAWLHTHKPSSYSRTPRFQKSQNVGGGTAFIVRESFSQIPSTISAYTSFEASAITLKPRSSKLTVFSVYRPPVSSNYAKPFLDEFYSFLCSAATTPHEFLITGDFNIHVDDPSDPQAIAFLSMLERISQLRLTLSTNPPRWEIDMLSKISVM